MKKIAVFASGAGSNAANIIAGSDGFEVALIVSNKVDAGVVKIATANNIPTLLLDKERFFSGDAYVLELKERGIEWIVLAGFLWKVPPALIHAFPEHIINIHPALLPKYGGRGMYGRFVHQAVINQKEKESGITIHFVDEVYDHGKIIFQATCTVEPGDNAATLEQKVRLLELEHYPKVITTLVNETAAR